MSTIIIVLCIIADADNYSLLFFSVGLSFYVETKSKFGSLLIWPSDLNSSSISSDGFHAYMFTHINTALNSDVLVKLLFLSMKKIHCLHLLTTNVPNVFNTYVLITLILCVNLNHWRGRNVLSGYFCCLQILFFCVRLHQVEQVLAKIRYSSFVCEDLLVAFSFYIVINLF